MSIVEVFPGTCVPMQYVAAVYERPEPGQWAPDSRTTPGDLIGTFQFAANVASGTNQSKILIATTEAATFFNVPAT
jgi:hypothetical protein